MNQRPRAFKLRGAGLTDGFKTVASDTGSLPRGGTPGEAQSEREKRGSRHSDVGVESSSQRSGEVTPTARPKAAARLGQQDREGMGPALALKSVGAGRPMPGQQLSQPATTRAEQRRLRTVKRPNVETLTMEIGK
jgi:hypothetical protein